jgi:hypothetical protein
MQLWLGELTKNVNDSLRKKCDRMAQMTTDSDPIGVTRMASVNALYTYQVSRRSSPSSLPSLSNSLSNKVQYFADDHHDHPRPPKPALEVRVALASLVSVLLGGLEEALLLDNEAGLASAVGPTVVMWK